MKTRLQDYRETLVSLFPDSAKCLKSEVSEVNGYLCLAARHEAWHDVSYFWTAFEVSPQTWRLRASSSKSIPSPIGTGFFHEVWFPVGD